MVTTVVASAPGSPELLKGAEARAEPAPPAPAPRPLRFDGAALRARADRAINQTLLLRRAMLGRDRGPKTERNSLDCVAHDLANNLNAAQLCLAALSGSERSPAQRSRDYLAVLRHSLRQMEQLVADIRDMRQMALGRFTLDATAGVSPECLVSAALDPVTLLAGGRRLVAACPAGFPSVRVDERRIQRVFANLVGNALKFTGPGGLITVGADFGPHDRHVTFFVRDDGEGITEADHDRIFEPYWQRDRVRGRGSGLGLAICRGIVEAHGGQMTVSSWPGVGSTFAFTLPLA